MRALLLVCAVLATLTSLLPLTASATVEGKTWGAVKGLYSDSATDSLEKAKGSSSGTAAVNVYNSFPYDWKLPFYGSMQISTYYGGAYCWGGTNTFHTGDEHHALDWNLPGEGDSGRPVVAPASGWMTVGSGGCFGNYVYVYAGNGYSYRLAHLDRFAVSYCGWVNRGQVLGYIGCTGCCKGSHLHFVVYRNGASVPQNGISGHWTLRLCQYYSSGQ